MKLRTDRVLTTHAGNLPRALELTTTLEALEAGRMPDPAVLDARVRRAVGDDTEGTSAVSKADSISDILGKTATVDLSAQALRWACECCNRARSSAQLAA
jgi:hypothetical protein